MKIKIETPSRLGRWLEWIGITFVLISLAIAITGVALHVRDLEADITKNMPVEPPPLPHAPAVVPEALTVPGSNEPVTLRPIQKPVTPGGPTPGAAQQVAGRAGVTEKSPQTTPASNTYSTPPQPARTAPAPDAASRLDAGANVDVAAASKHGPRLRGERPMVILAATEEAAAELRDHPDRLPELVKKGLLLSAPRRAAVAVEETRNGFVKVQVLGEGSRARVGWVRTDQVVGK